MAVFFAEKTAQIIRYCGAVWLYCVQLGWKCKRILCFFALACPSTTPMN